MKLSGTLVAGLLACGCLLPPVAQLDYDGEAATHDSSDAQKDDRSSTDARGDLASSTRRADAFGASAEHIADNAWIIDFTHGASAYKVKNNALRVRCVR